MAAFTAATSDFAVVWEGYLEDPETDVVGVTVQLVPFSTSPYVRELGLVPIARYRGLALRSGATYCAVLSATNGQGRQSSATACVTTDWDAPLVTLLVDSVPGQVLPVQRDFTPRGDSAATFAAQDLVSGVYKVLLLAWPEFCLTPQHRLGAGGGGGG